MKRILMCLLITGIYAGTTFAEDEPIASFGFTGDTRSIQLSTTPASPTQIMTKDRFVQRNWVISNSSFTIYISSFNTTISTGSATSLTSTFAINRAVSLTGAPNLEPWMWTPDGPNSVYQGGMWAISQPVETPQRISVFRSK